MIFTDPSVNDTTSSATLSKERLVCDQNGHTNAGCDQNGHMRLMSPRRLATILVTLGWSVRELARRSGEHRTTVMRWIDGTAAIDPERAECLERLEAVHLANPLTRRSLNSWIGSPGSVAVPVEEEQHHRDSHRRTHDTYMSVTHSPYAGEQARAGQEQ